ncbi:MATE family efflux transporter [Sporomusa malonica]|uniref:Probable multidrug resistance protein NorM n=2 Tax=Sporomusa malonica TaxID=112901 RepID=A0A1W1ZSG6_9FIRM|nr:putative efflux protein, MATE family [Sporomusa malonica]
MQDFTKGNETKQIITFTIPMFIGSFFQQVYSLIDSVIVGKYIGAHALAAVGTSMPIIFFVVVVMNGFASGMAIVVTQLFGAKRIVELRNTVFSTFLALIAMCLVLSAGGVAAAKPILTQLLRVPETIIGDATVFLQIYFGGLVFVFLYNAVSFLLRSVGDSRTPVYFLIISSLINVALAVLFVKEWGLGVAGAAWSTFIAQGVASLMMIVYTYIKVPVYRIQLSEVTFDRILLSMALAQGVPNALQQGFLGMGGLALQGLVNSFGEVTIAAVSVAFRVEQIVSQISLNLSRAMGIFTGQNIGAGNIDRVERGVKRILMMGSILGVLCSGLVIVFGESIIGIFLSSDTTNMAMAEQVMLQGQQYLAVTGFFFAFVFVTNILAGVLRGSGDVMFSTVGTLVIFVLRIAAAYMMAVIPQIGYQCIWWSQPFMWVPGTIGLWLRYRSGIWQTKSIVSRLGKESS